MQRGSALHESPARQSNFRSHNATRAKIAIRIVSIRRIIDTYARTARMYEIKTTTLGIHPGHYPHMPHTARHFTTSEEHQVSFLQIFHIMNYHALGKLRTRITKKVHIILPVHITGKTGAVKILWPCVTPTVAHADKVLCRFYNLIARGKLGYGIRHGKRHAVERYNHSGIVGRHKLIGFHNTRKEIFCRTYIRRQQQS